MAVSLCTVRDRIRKYFGLPVEPTREQLERQIVELQRDRRFLIRMTHDALKRAEQADSRAVKHAGIAATVVRWPKARKVMVDNLLLYARAVRQRRNRTRSQLKAFCVKYDIRGWEDAND
ncbi:hypothetical protein pEaSNUABM8_00151 [Erwinia phage pEa_SNUABM_8]|nr:hypothetical protein pEaSNUABM8_00151 [Erwinia phage pEa_SNUABM_8]QVW54903.1 hypothetical protein pEaSNUABM4_00150 [Erwinia phage pEa_SNUABM_4]